MIVITGAAGFIASVLVGQLNGSGLNDLLLVDDFSKSEKSQNYITKKYKAVDRKDFLLWFEENAKEVDFVFHLGARTDTMEMDNSIFQDLNLNYSQEIWRFCTTQQIPLVYASSAATYGNGEFGYKDDQTLVEKLQPLNPYAISKNDFDKWVLQQKTTPPFWAGLKFFNVYGPNEYHKGKMASVIFHAFHQIQDKSIVQLFRSHNPKYADGGQLRDFIYVKDIVNICLFLYENQKPENSAIYNAGTGIARSYADLAKAVFKALNKEVNIHFIDTPEKLRDKYQYFTQADMDKLHQIGYNTPFFTLEEGVSDYVTQYLMQDLMQDRYF